MNRLQLIQRVRSLTRDFSNSIFREQDIIDYINEGIERVAQYIPECRDMVTLDLNTDEVQYLPKTYHSLLALYSASRCFFQDERFFQSGNLMNEFETKLDGLKTAIESGVVVIIDALGVAVDHSISEDYVVDNYFEHTSDDDDLDNGVEGVQ